MDGSDGQIGVLFGIWNENLEIHKNYARNVAIISCHLKRNDAEKIIMNELAKGVRVSDKIAKIWLE